MEKLDLVKKSFAMESGIHKDFFAGSETTVYTDSLMLDILTSELDCTESIVMLLEKSKFEDCYILLRHVLETFLYLWLMLEGEIYHFTRIYRIIPKAGSTKMQSRDETFEKWRKEKDSGLSQYEDIIDIQKGKDEDIIKVTYEWKGLFSSNEPKEAARIIPWYVFAFQDYDPDTRFLTGLPSFSLKESKRIRNVLKERFEEQKTLYHKYFYVESIIKNLKLNKLVTEDQIERITVHYNFFSNFLHPNKRIVRTRPAEFSFNFSGENIEVQKELVLLYLCRLQFLFLSKMVAHFQTYYPKGNYEEYEKHAKELDVVSRDLWFFDNEPSGYDIETSKMRTWWLEKSGETVDRNRIFYYTDPIDRLRQLMSWKSSLK
ncbi:MAG: hypothetical protein QXZ70_00505 [Candidatus Bathyarchaeia archaeon]